MEEARHFAARLSLVASVPAFDLAQLVAKLAKLGLVCSKRMQMPESDG